MGEPDGAVGSAGRGRWSGWKRVARTFAGYLVGGACLVWLFHDVHPRAVLAAAARLQWRWAALAVVFDIVSYLCQGWRWRLLLRPAGDIRILRTTQAVYAGLFANELLPMRPGELVRAYLVSQWLSKGMAAVLPSLLVERFLDSVWLAVLLGWAATFVSLPHDLARAADWLGGAVLLAAAGFLLLVFLRQRETHESPSVNPKQWTALRLPREAFRRLETGLRQIGLSASFWGAAAVSLAVLLLQIVAFWLTLLACGLRLGILPGAVVLLVVRLGTAIPNAPANVGSYQFFVVMGLSLFGVEKAAAAGCSFVVFAVLTLPLWLIGFVAFSRSGMTLSGVRGKIGELIRQRRLAA